MGGEEDVLAGGASELQAEPEPLVGRKAFCQMVDSEHKFVSHPEYPQFAMISTHGGRALASDVPEPTRTSLEPPKP